MLLPEYTTRFKKDLKTAKKRNWDLDMLKDVIRQLSNEQQLPEKNKEHNLSGIWSGCKNRKINIDFENNEEANQFKVIFQRKK